MDISRFFDVESFVHNTIFLDVMSPWEPLERLSSYLNSYSDGTAIQDIPGGAHIQNPKKVFVGKNVLIEPGVFIQGPCIIGDGSEIRHGAYIRGGAIIGRECVVGHASEVKGSILLNGAKVPHFNYCGDSILGNDTNMGAGSITANVRFDRKTIYAFVDGGKIDTGRTKFGLLLGDTAQLGCNVVTSPGTVLDKGVLIPPYTHLKGLIAHERESLES